MTYLTESRDVLAKTLYVFAHREGRDERVRAWEFDTIPEGMKDQRYEWADALIASGAVIDASTLAEVHAERQRQDARWGEQNHPDGTGSSASLLDDIGALWDDNSNADVADAARDRVEALAAVNRCTYAHILAEEFFEALAEDDPRGVRAELIQVAAVAVAWVEAIDRRALAAALTERSQS